jgi:hypothetical protein
MRKLVYTACIVLGGALAGSAQSAAPAPILRARHAAATVKVKVFHVGGSLRIMGWDRDSIVVRGRVQRGDHFYLAGSDSGMKFGVESRASGRDDPLPCDLVVYLPRRAQLSVKTVSANVTASDVSGWFYSVSGSLQLSGSATSLDAQTMGGNLDAAVTSPWVRLRTGSGHLVVRGSPQDVDAATVSGTLDFAATGVLRAEVVSVTGDIHYYGAPARGSIADFSNHSGAVDFTMPSSASGVFTLSSVTGPIENSFRQVRPAGSPTHAVRLTLGRGDAQVTVRTFKGPIRLKAQ